MQFTRISILIAGLVIAISGCQSKDPSATVENVAALPPGVTLLETVEKKTGDVIVIPYKKFELDNGLTVVLHEDDSDPLVHIDVTYHVGSAREELGKSGFAHFFEHMMFEGTEHAADGEHVRLVTDAGGTYNGSTSTDRTNYFETVPDNQIEKMLWLEADRMGFFLDAVTQEKFEIQRATVKNERGQRMDNQPYGLRFERTNEALFPAGHPYSWQTIGYVEDLDRVDVNDLKKFFLRWYGPNNATLTLGGNFNEIEVLAWISKYFGSIPRGPEVAMPGKPVVTLDADRHISMEDNVALPLLLMSYPTVNLYHADEAPLDVLMSVLGIGDTSLLYKNMVKTGYAVQAGAGHGCQELSCSFTVLALLNPAAGKTLADLEKITRDSLDEFEKRGVLDDDLERVKMSIVSGMIYGLESVAGKVGRLAMYETYRRDPNYAAEDIARYENVTKDDVMRVYRQYVKGKSSVILSIVPQGQLAQIAAPDSWESPQRELPDYASVSEDELEFRRAVDDFDRSVMPSAGENPFIIAPKIWRADLENDVSVLGTTNAETPTTAIQMRIDAGQRNESLDKLGLAALTAAMLNEATTETSNEELSNKMQKLGAHVAFSGGDSGTTLSIRSLSQNLDETLAIAAEMLLKPKFDQEDFDRLQDQFLQRITQGKKDAARTAANVYQLLLFGKDNSFAYANMGTEATISAITLDDVEAFYAAHYSPRIASIVAVSDQDKATLLEKLAVFDAWEGGDVAPTSLKPFPDLGETKIYLVDKPGAAQSELRIGKRAMPFDATGEYYRAGLANLALGGNSNARLNLNIREEKGYTYGAYSFYTGNRDYGDFTAFAAVRADVTGDSIVEFENEIRRYAEEGITEVELAYTRRSVGQRDARRYETPTQKLAFLSQILEFDLQDDFVDMQKNILAEVGKNELDEVAGKQLSMDDMIIVVVGDKQAILPSLKELGYEIIELDEAGNEIAG
jgi:zinc protease